MADVMAVDANGQIAAGDADGGVDGNGLARNCSRVWGVFLHTPGARRQRHLHGRQRPGRKTRQSHKSWM